MDQLGITSLSLTVKLVHKIMSLFWLFLLVMYAQHLCVARWRQTAISHSMSIVCHVPDTCEKARM